MHTLIIMSITISIIIIIIIVIDVCMYTSPNFRVSPGGRKHSRKELGLDAAALAALAAVEGDGLC